jgi:hypothetical protein
MMFFARGAKWGLRAAMGLSDASCPRSSRCSSAESAIEPMPIPSAGRNGGG